VKIINNFLQGKQIVGVDKHFRVQVQAESGGLFGIDSLSSGEKQILLFLGEIRRRLRPGGLLLIDEPELHLHPRWQRLLVQALTDLCKAYDAQMILTTHSQEIADAVYEHELILLDDIFKRLPAETSRTETSANTPAEVTA
jgi:predicted ATP-dependent endonuclease of OLD family